MKKLSANSQGFTVIELLVVILVFVGVAVVAVTNVRNLKAEQRDTVSKADINAVYYQLESFYEKNGYYPEKIDAAALKGIDPESLKDDLGKTVNEDGGIYSYKGISCAETKCKRFELTAQLEKEATFMKQSLNN
jgi:prepilin-type N-terminal cleavage/methylation domain-containing protein